MTTWDLTSKLNCELFYNILDFIVLEFFGRSRGFYRREYGSTLFLFFWSKTFVKNSYCWGEYISKCIKNNETSLYFFPNDYGELLLK